MNRIVKIVLLALLTGGVLAGVIVGGTAWYAKRKVAESKRPLNVGPAPDPTLTARQARIAAVVEVAPAPLPKSIPLVGSPGTGAHGFPLQHVDAPGFRSLLYYKRYADLTRYFSELQDAFEKDPKKEYWVIDAADAFHSSAPEVGAALDAWVRAEPTSFAAALARGFHRSALGARSRGTDWASKTAKSDFAAMDAAFDGAAVELNRALSLRPRCMAARVGLVRMSDGRNALREDVLRRALRDCPSCYAIRATYMNFLEPRWGGSYAKMDAFARASREAAERDNPLLKNLSGFAAEDRADILRSQKKYAEALEALAPALALNEWAFLDSRARIRHAMGDEKGALDDYDRALGEHALSAGVLLERAEVKLALHQAQSAGEDTLRALQLDATYPNAAWHRDGAIVALWNESTVAHREGRREDAVRLAELALELAPNDHSLHALHFRAVLGLDPDRPGLEGDLRSAMQKNPDDVRAVQNLDYFLSTKRRFDLILPLWDDYLARHPDDGRAYLERSGTHHNMGHLTEAVADAKRACELGMNEGCVHAK